MISRDELNDIDIEKLSGNIAFMTNLVVVADKKIDNYHKGEIVESKDLLEPIWDNYSPVEQRKLGKSFRVLVEHGHYPKVKYVGKASNNHAKYEVL